MQSVHSQCAMLQSFLCQRVMQSIDDRRAVMQSVMQSVDDRRTAMQFGQCCQAQMQSAEVRVCQVVNMNSDQFNVRCRDTNKWEYWKLNVGIPTFSQCLVRDLETVKDSRNIGLNPISPNRNDVRIAHSDWLTAMFETWSFRSKQTLVLSRK